VHALLAWGGRHRDTNSRVFKHAACGTKLDDAGYCSTCALTPDPENVLMEVRRGRRALRDDPVAQALRPPRRLLEPIEV